MEMGKLVILVEAEVELGETWLHLAPQAPPRRVTLVALINLTVVAAVVVVRVKQEIQTLPVRAEMEFLVRLLEPLWFERAVVVVVLAMRQHQLLLVVLAVAEVVQALMAHRAQTLQVELQLLVQRILVAVVVVRVLDARKAGKVAVRAWLLFVISQQTQLV